MRWLFIRVFFFIFSLNTYGQADSNMVVPFALSDKIRLIRLEEQMNAKFEQIDKRFEQIDKRFEQLEKRFERLEDLVWASIFAMFGSVFTLIGFILWDRRTYLKPIVSQMEELKSQLEQQKNQSSKVQQVIDVLKEKAKDDDSLKELLKKFNLW